MLVELGLVEQRLKAVHEVLDGAPVVDVAQGFGVARQTVHVWLKNYATHGMAGLVDKSSRPESCPHQMSPVVEVRIVELRRATAPTNNTHYFNELSRVISLKHQSGKLPASHRRVHSRSASQQ